jgi:sensor histidine kinase YesM
MQTARRVKYGTIAGFWTLFALCITGQNYAVLALAGKPVSWLQAFSVTASYSYLWAAATPIILWLSRRFPLERRSWVPNTLLHIGLALFFGVAIKLTFEFIIFAIFGELRGPLTTSRLMRSIGEMLDYEMMLYGIIVLIDHGIGYYQRFQQAQLREAQLETRLAQSQLQALKMQLDPHFLFNTLNTVSELVHEDAEAAERMIVRLSELLRLSLENSGTHEVPLRKELDFLERYLEIEKIRFETRLSVKFDIDPGTLDARVPNLILQPLVENAIRHGIGNSAEGGAVSIVARRENMRLELEVSDTGAARVDPMLPIREGVGIANTRARLERLYGTAQQFVLCRGAHGGIECRITMPLLAPADATNTPALKAPAHAHG